MRRATNDLVHGLVMNATPTNDSDHAQSDHAIVRRIPGGKLSA
jgi:hypothetical protein